MLYISITMLTVFLADMLLGVGLSGWLTFNRDLIFSGQVWRIITFIFLPPASQPIFILFTLYFYYFIGGALENEWGPSRFTFYYLCGVIGNIVAGMIAGSASNIYLNMSLFLAFAQLYPEHQIMLFFILPVKIKYIAYVDWALYGIALLFAIIRMDLSGCLSIAASLLNFFLFFGPDLMDKFNNWRRYRGRRKDFKRNVRNNDFWR
jgi:membrane associated rhomboid family serine protease